MPNAPDDIFADDDDDVIEVGGSTPPDQSQPAGRDPAGPPPSLRAEWDGQNRCWVALHQGETPLEKWRPPTKAEWDALRERGVIVRPSPLMRSNIPQQTPPVGAAGDDGGIFGTLKRNAVPFGLGIGATILGMKYLLPALQQAAQPSQAKNSRSADSDDMDDAVVGDFGDDAGED